MTKFKIIQLVIMLFVLILEILPYGAVCNFAISPEYGGGLNRVTYSYFDLLPFGYANFGPFLTAILTCVIIIFLILSITVIKKNINLLIRILTCTALFTSVLPLMYGINYYSFIALLITLLLGIKILLEITYIQKVINKIL